MKGIHAPELLAEKGKLEGRLGGSVVKSVQLLVSAHALMVRELEPCVGLCADSLCHPLSLGLSLARALSLSQNKVINLFFFLKGEFYVISIVPQLKRKSFPKATLDFASLTLGG